MELLDLETSFQEIENLPIVRNIVLPINAELEKFKEKILKLKFPLWIKLNSSTHKVKIDAVRKCHDFSELEKVYKELRKRFPGKKFIIQENISGIEMIAGIKEDKTFGRVLMIGAGGTYTEIIKDVEFRILPITEEEIEKAIKELRIYRLLKERNANINKLIALIENFSKLDIKEADLNPIIVNETQAVIVDSRVSI